MPLYLGSKTKSILNCSLQHMQSEQTYICSYHQYSEEQFISDDNVIYKFKDLIAAMAPFFDIFFCNVFPPERHLCFYLMKYLVRQVGKQKQVFSFKRIRIIKDKIAGVNIGCPNYLEPIMFDR